MLNLYASVCKTSLDFWFTFTQKGINSLPVCPLLVKKPKVDMQPNSKQQLMSPSQHPRRRWVMENRTPGLGGLYGLHMSLGKELRVHAKNSRVVKSQSREGGQ